MGDKQAGVGFRRHHGGQVVCYGTCEILESSEHLGSPGEVGIMESVLGQHLPNCMTTREHQARSQGLALDTTGELDSCSGEMEEPVGPGHVASWHLHHKYISVLTKNHTCPLLEM